MYLPNACVYFLPIYLMGQTSLRSACRDCSGWTSSDKTLNLLSSMCVWSLFSENKISWPYINFRVGLSNCPMLLGTPWKSGSRLTRGEQLWSRVGSPLVGVRKMKGMRSSASKCKSQLETTARRSWQEKKSKNPTEFDKNVAESHRSWKRVAVVTGTVALRWVERIRSQSVKWVRQGKMVSEKAGEVRPQNHLAQDQAPAIWACTVGVIHPT